MVFAEIESELEQFQSQSQKHTADLEELRNQQNDINRSLHRQEKSVEKYLLKRSLLLQKKNECTSNIRDLGVLPEEAFERYTRMSMEKVRTEVGCYFMSTTVLTKLLIELTAIEATTQDQREPQKVLACKQEGF